MSLATTRIAPDPLRSADWTDPLRARNPPGANGCDAPLVEGTRWHLADEMGSAASGSSGTLADRLAGWRWRFGPAAPPPPDGKTPRFPMTTSTLTSLAILRVRVDHGGDYLDYLRPFVIHALAANSHRPVTSELVRTYVESEFGLVIPSRTIAIVLRRLSRSSEPIRRRDRAYHVEGPLSTAPFDQNRAVAEGHIGAVLADLREYSLRSGRTIDSDDSAVAAITAFLSKFDVSCLRSYLRGTALPSLHDSSEKDVVLVSSYVRNIQRSQPDRFESFMVVVQGHMLANALLCPDLSMVGQTYRGAVFYLDTPLLVQCLELEDRTRRDRLWSSSHCCGDSVGQSQCSPIPVRRRRM